MSTIALTQELIDKVRAIVQQCPGIDQDRFATRLGLKPYFLKQGGARCRNRMNRFIGQLVDRGYVQAMKEQFASVGDLPKIYPGDWQPPKKKLFQPDKGALFECRSYFDPSVVEKPNRTIRTPQEEDMNRTSEQIITETEFILDRYRDKNQPFTKKELLIAARINNQFLSRHPELNQKIDAAVAASKPTIAQPKAVEPQEDCKAAELEQRIAELEAANRELRQQLGEARVVPPQKVAIPPIAWLKQQKQIELHSLETIGREVAELQQRIQQAESDRGAVERNLEAIDRLLEQAEGLEAPVYTNGNKQAVAA